MTTTDDRQARLADVANNYPDQFLSCRDMGHAWRPHSAVWLEGGQIERALECTRCKTARRQILDREGYILLGYYYYADGYQIPGIGRLDTDARAGLRKASLERLMRE